MWKKEAHEKRPTGYDQMLYEDKKKRRKDRELAGGSM